MFSTTITDPICAAAHALTDVHRIARCHPGFPENPARSVLIAAIDRQVARRTPVVDESIPKHPETVGALIDRLAAAADLAMHHLETLGGGSEITHRTWSDFADLSLAYRDLVADLARGRKRLPPTATGPIPPKDLL
ncbi:DUF4254 domain-containing protein [Nocardia sp. NPDC052001]|uniref:DUF4254 domain-containing protein n=1 Tax=Nocardia sp. NPDC052001 TaxID=3154853 RepID=UPI003416C42E